jgi:hypothetical protein
MFSTGGGGCEEAYGFLPCSNSLAGSISLIVAYGYILLQGANLISDGSELLLEVSSIADLLTDTLKSRCPQNCQSFVHILEMRPLPEEWDLRALPSLGYTFMYGAEV